MNRLQPLLLCAAMQAPLWAEAAERPNIVYIVTDQQTATAMSCMGNTDLHTPNMDRLAQAGVLFRNAYCATPLSGPSRASMFTGYIPHEVEMELNGAPMPDSIRTQTLGTLVAQAGYDCAYAGKWHVHEPSMPNGKYGFRTLHPHKDTGLAESCVAFLKEKHNRPFFLVAGFDNPHNVCEYARDQNLPWGNLPNVPSDEYPGLPSNFARQPYDADVITLERGGNYAAYPTIYYTADDWRKYRSFYFRLVEKVDAEIGKIIDEIDRQNLWKNTVIIFTSDHGDGMGAHQWNQKSALYEEVINIPFIVTLPGKKNAGKELPQLINNGVDFFASVCDWAGAVIPNHCSGVSFKTLVEKADAAMPHQEYVVTETTFDKGCTRGWAVRSVQYKYVLYDKGRYREQLYELSADRGEMRNLAIEKKYADVLQQYRNVLKKWMEQHHVKQIRKDVHLVPGVENEL